VVKLHYTEKKRK